jgi:hypothetical protein
MKTKVMLVSLGLVSFLCLNSIALPFSEKVPEIPLDDVLPEGMLGPSTETPEVSSAEPQEIPYPYNKEIEEILFFNRNDASEFAKKITDVLSASGENDCISEPVLKHEKRTPKSETEDLMFGVKIKCVNDFGEIKFFPTHLQNNEETIKEVSSRINGYLVGSGRTPLASIDSQEVKVKSEKPGLFYPYIAYIGLEFPMDGERVDATIKEFYFRELGQDGKEKGENGYKEFDSPEKAMALAAEKIEHSSNLFYAGAKCTFVFEAIGSVRTMVPKCTVITYF